jgi:hypothetical protein
MVREADGLYFVRGRDTAVRPVSEPTHHPGHCPASPQRPVQVVQPGLAKRSLIARTGPHWSRCAGWEHASGADHDSKVLRLQFIPGDMLLRDYRAVLIARDHSIIPHLPNGQHLLLRMRWNRGVERLRRCAKIDVHRLLSLIYVRNRSSRIAGYEGQGQQQGSQDTKAFDHYCEGPARSSRIFASVAC